MDPIGPLVLGLIIGLLIGAAIAVYAYRTARQKTRDEGAVLRVEAEKTLAEAQAKSRELLVVAKDEAIKVRDSAESEFKERRAEIQREEERQVRRRTDLEAQREKLDQRNKAADKRQQQLDKLAQDVEKLQSERVAALEKAAAMTRDEARNELIGAVREETRGGHYRHNFRASTRA